jgi:ABC-type multidrug transport system permease subunit
MANSTVEVLVLILGGLLIGWRITSDPGSAALAVLILLLLRFAVLWIGIFVGLSFRGEGATMAVQVLVWPIGFLSTAIVSAETMPGWLGAIAAWNPLSATASAARQLFGNPTGITEGPLVDGAVWLAVGWPLLLTAVFLPLSARAYRKLRS